MHLAVMSVSRMGIFILGAQGMAHSLKPKAVYFWQLHFRRRPSHALHHQHGMPSLLEALRHFPIF